MKNRESVLIVKKTSHLIMFSFKSIEFLFLMAVIGKFAFFLKIYCLIAVLMVIVQT